MTLDNTAKIGDIITELQDLTLINQKAEMAGVIGAPTTATSNNQDFVSTIQDAKDIISIKSGLDNTLPLLDMVNSITIGKRWASGSVVGTNPNSLVVTGLPFKPSVIIVKLQNVSTSANIGLHVVGNSNPIFGGNISFYVRSSGVVVPVVNVSSDGFTFRDGDIGNGNNFNYLVFE